MAELLVRACKRHRVTLEERPGDALFCPAGRHRLRKDEPFLVVNSQTRRVQYEASLEKGALRMGEGKEPAEVTAHKPKSVTLERAKFQDGGDQVLFVRLTREARKLGGDPFRVRWLQTPRTGKRGTRGGVAKTCAGEPEARAAFRAAVKSALSQGWVQMVIRQGGGHVLELKPIPAPKKPARPRSISA